jgi:hypothetical protein
MINRLNELIKDPAHLIVDPWEDEPFKHTIPRDSISEEIVTQLQGVKPQLTKVRNEKRAEIVAARRSEAIRHGDPPTRTATGGISAWDMVQLVKGKEAREAEEASARAIINRAAENSTQIRANAAVNTQRMAAANAMAWGAAQNALAVRNAMAFQSWGNF